MVKICHFSDVHWRGIARHKEYFDALNDFFKQLRKDKPDIIINTGDTFHTKTQGITPEIIQKLVWMFKELASIAPVYSILGNHDGNVTNIGRENLIVPIHSAIKNPNAVVLKESKTHLLEKFGIALSVFSVFDKENWQNVKPIKGYINIALYHGPITGCYFENNWKVPQGELNKEFFVDFDFVLLGDIHKHQFVAHRPSENNVIKPWMGYPGTLIQQNYGESVDKGYLVWDIKSAGNWNVGYIKLQNRAPFLTIPWGGSVEEVLEAVEPFPLGARYRITSSVMIPQLQSRQLVTELKKHGAAEVIFKTDIVSKMDSVSTSSGLKISKKSLAQDPEAITKLYKEYLSAHSDIYPMDEIQVGEAEEIIRKLLHKLNKNTEDFSARNVIWSIKELKFDNLYGYGEGNRIDFSRLENIVGIFGKNRSGKSSLVGALMFTLFNTSDRGPIKNAHVINDSKDYCCGSVRINVGGTDYIIERRTERTLSKKNREASRLEGKSSTSVNLWKIRIDELGREVKVANNGIGRDDTDRLIRRLIGTPEDFLLTAFASQGGLNRFIDNKATKRKEVLNRFLELDVFDRLCSFAKEKYSSLNNMGKNYSSDVWSRTILKTQKDIKSLEEDIEKVTASITTISEKRDELNLWITTHENQAAAIEKATVENLEKQTQDREREIRSAQDILKENKEALKEKKSRLRIVTRLQKKYDLEMLQSSLTSMQSIETSLGELKGTLDLQMAELSTQQKAVEKLEKAPCGTSFPECHFIKDGHLAKGTIRTQKRVVKQLGQELKKAQKIFKKYAAQKIEESIKTCKELGSESELLDANIVSLEESAIQRKREISILRKDLRSTRSKLRRAIKVLEQLESEEFKKKKQMLQKAQEEIAILETKRFEHLMSLGALQQKLEKLLNEQEEGVNLIKKLKLYESIQSAFSKNGIPAMILKSQLPAINREMANVLDNLVDFTVTLESDVSANIMDVYFEDGKSKRVIELGSGMEKTVCSLALRVALGNLSSLPRPEIFILDESFGALDEDNLQKGMELLSLFSGYFKSIFVITHVTPIKEVADEIIEIKSDGIESTICYK